MNTSLRLDYRKTLFSFSKWITASLFFIIAIQIVLLGMSTPYFYNQYIGDHLSGFSSYTVLVSFLTGSTLFCFLYFFALPVFIGTTIFHIRLADVGLRRPLLNKHTIRLIRTSILLLIVLGYILTRQASVQQFYLRSLGNLDLPTFILVNLTLLPIYYFAEEFFFRGFLFLTLWRLVGWHSYWLTDILFTFAHQYKPVPELCFSTIAGIILNYMTYKTKSFFPAMISHGLLGMFINVLVYCHI